VQVFVNPGNEVADSLSCLWATRLCACCIVNLKNSVTQQEHQLNAVLLVYAAIVRRSEQLHSGDVPLSELPTTSLQQNSFVGISALTRKGDQ
jgi:hypothetical protein